MKTLSDDAKELLYVLAAKNSRWSAADLAHIYERPTPNVKKTIEELTSAELIVEQVSEIGRRKTDQLKITEAGVKLVDELKNE